MTDNFVNSADKPLNILVLCTGNSARSIMGEVTLNKFGAGKVQAYSAGSKPTGSLNSHVKALLDQKGYDTSRCRSKSWDEFAGPEAPKMDIVVTVCDNAAGETCPYWPGIPVTIHCGFLDPATQTGSELEIMEKVDAIYAAIEEFAKQVTAVSFHELTQSQIREKLRTIAAECSQT
jgi:arsenate reductase